MDLTAHEFLTKLVADEHAASAFAADPDGSLRQAGLEQLSATDLVQAVGLVMDQAPVEAVEACARAVQPGLDTLAGSQHVALTYPMPLETPVEAPLEADDDNERASDMPTPEIFSAAGDVDETMRPVATQSEETTNTDIDNTENTEQNVGSDNAIGSGNEFGVDSLVGDVNTGDLNVGNVAGNGVTDVVGGVQGAVEGGDVTGGLKDLGGVNDVVGGVDDAVQGGDVMGKAGDLAGAGDVTGGLQDLGGVTGGVTGTVEDVTGELPVDGAVEGVMPETGLTAPVNAVEDVTGGVENTAGDLTGGMLDF